MSFRMLFDSGSTPPSCLDRLSDAEWKAFVFDHPVPEKGGERWYVLPESEDRFFYREPSLVLERLCRLLPQSLSLIADYSVEQIKQGLWCLISAFELPDLLEEKEIPWELRRDCILKLEGLYSGLFTRPGFEKVAFMYWDPLSYSFYANWGKPRDEDHSKVQEAMFQCLLDILAQPSRLSFLSAVHGLGHLMHPSSSRAILDALAFRQDLRPGDEDYALSCAKGKVDTQPAPELG